MTESFQYINKVEGELSFAGDKSISHRALLFSALADGTSYIENLSKGGDVKSTQSCLAGLGVKFSNGGGRLKVTGKGFKGFQKPAGELYAGNSGTTARLLSGILAMQNFESVITGDESLSKRPMSRIIEPLTYMGAEVKSDEGLLPLKYFPSTGIKAINYKSSISSAQVKSAVLLAGLHLDEITSYTEEIESRNHTELMLGLRQERSSRGITTYASKGNYPQAKEYFVPGDISSASFFIVLALLAGKSDLRIKNVLLNPLRTGYIELLKKMGGNIEIEEAFNMAGELYGTIRVKESRLNNIEIPLEIIPNIIDEIPILTIAGIFAEGTFTIKGAKELRIKESDRIKAVCHNLRLAGLTVDEYEDGYTVSGMPEKDKALFESFDDHRIAMSFAIFSLLLFQGGKINNFDIIKISNPEFSGQLQSIIR